MNYLSSMEAAKAMGITVRRVQQMCKQGEISGAVKKGHSWLIPENAVWPDSVEKKKPMPIGISDFKTATTSYYYVDKTLLIRDFLDTKPMVSLFTRPRRFGKTLNMDMVRVFFEKHRRTPPFISRISRYGSVVLIIPGIRESIRSYS